jgi:hypothetical protein
MLASAAIDTLITGLHCLYVPGAVAQLHDESVRQLPTMLEFMADAKAILPDVLAQCIAGLGLSKGDKAPTIEVMAGKVDKAMGGQVATELYKKFCRPTSKLLGPRRRGLDLAACADERPAHPAAAAPWLRRSPARIADASLGALTAAVAKGVERTYKRAAEFADRHGDRVLPPIVVIGAGGFSRMLAPRDLVTTVRLVREGYAYARAGDGGDPAGHVARLRGVMEQLLLVADPGAPKGSLDPSLDFIAAKIAAG